MPAFSLAVASKRQGELVFWWESLTACSESVFTAIYFMDVIYILENTEMMYVSP